MVEFRLNRPDRDCSVNLALNWDAKAFSTPPVPLSSIIRRKVDALGVFAFDLLLLECAHVYYETVLFEGIAEVLFSLQVVSRLLSVFS